MSGAFGAGLRFVAVGLLVLAMLVVPFAPSAAPALAGVLPGACGHGSGTTGAGLVTTQPGHPDALPCAAAAEPTQPSDGPSGVLDRTCCPGPDGPSAPDNGCMAVGCHAMPASLPAGAPPLPATPPAIAIMMPGIDLPDGIAVDPALKPPRSFS